MHRPFRPTQSSRRLLTALHDARAGHHRRSNAAHPAPARELARPPAKQGDPDVVLNIPRLHVDEINLKLGELKAHVSLDAKVLDLLRLDVGVDAELRDVGLEIRGVDAKATLRVRLENLTVILDRVMRTIDTNPELLGRLLDRVGAALEEVGAGAREAVGELGRGAGSAVEQVGSGAGGAVEQVGRTTATLADGVAGAARSVVGDPRSPNGGHGR